MAGIQPAQRGLISNVFASQHSTSNVSLAVLDGPANGLHIQMVYSPTWDWPDLLSLFEGMLHGMKFSCVRSLAYEGDVTFKAIWITL